MFLQGLQVFILYTILAIQNVKMFSVFGAKRGTLNYFLIPSRVMLSVDSPKTYYFQIDTMWYFLMHCDILLSN